MHAGGGLLGHAEDRLAELRVPAGLRGDALLDGGEQRLLLVVGRIADHGEVLLRLHAEVDQQGGVAAIVEDHVRRAAVAPLEDAVRKFPVFFQVLAFERSEEQTSELPSLLRISYAVLYLKKTTYHSKKQ